MRVSILAMAFLPPLRAFCSASSRRDWASLTWASRSFLSLSSIMATSCSARSSSASLAASIMDLWALSSDILASEVISSRSCPRLFISASHLLLAPWMAWLVQVCWDRVSLVSASSCSIILLFLSDCSSRVRASSRAFWLALTLLSAAMRASWAALLALTSSSYLAWTSRMVAWILLMFLWLSALAALACSRATPRSTTSVSNFFFILRASTLLGLGLQLHLHAIDGLGEVLLGGSELLVLLSDAALDLLPDLGELQGSSQHLVLLLLQGALGLRQSGLQLHLLSLQPLADFVNLVDGAASLGDLVHDVLDLIGQGLVLAPDLLQLKNRLVIGILNPEEFSRDIAGLLLSTVQIQSQAVNLLLPLANNSVALLGLLFHGRVQNLSLVEVVGHVGQVGVELGLGPLNLSQLGAQLLDGGLTLREASLQLQAGHL